METLLAEGETEIQHSLAKHWKSAISNLCGKPDGNIALPTFAPCASVAIPAGGSFLESDPHRGGASERPIRPISASKVPRIDGPSNGGCNAAHHAFRSLAHELTLSFSTGPRCRRAHTVRAAATKLRNLATAVSRSSMISPQSGPAISRSRSI